ncbi:copper homeostasis protein CutC [Cohaesibacter celericrescens]|uniref:copper homeostasis protein CutC n=1 Tax=Cohaesibacter celericrescens TaxID=2067669 RepID=UPI00356555AF
MSVENVRPVQSNCLLEVCVDSVAGLECAIEGGADRIELCSSLELGGLTPSAGFMQTAAHISPVPVYALIRPRSGDFVYSVLELDLIEHDIEQARAAGLDGVVIGVSLPDLRLDIGALTRLKTAAKGLDCTLHRAFDLVPDFDVALEQAITLGFSRILSSGGALSAEQGLAMLRHLCKRSSGRISIMPGGGVGAWNVQQFMALDGIKEVHGSCSSPSEAIHAKVTALGFASESSKHTDASKVRALKAALLVPSSD